MSVSPPAPAPAQPEASRLRPHPLDSLTSVEISAASLALRKHVASHTDIKAIKFITCALANPPKRDVLAFLGIPLTTGEEPSPWKEKEIARKADLDFIDVVSGDTYNAILVMGTDEWSLETLTKLPEGTQPQMSLQELVAAESAVRQSAQVQKYAAEVGLKPENIYADGWVIGWDERFPKRRLQQALLFARFHQHDNLYAHPLDFIPILDANTLEVIHIDFPPRRFHSDNKPDAAAKLSAPTTEPPPLTKDPLEASGRERFPYPEMQHEYLPDFLAQQSNFKANTREPLKPLHILQPEGVSFTMNGNEISWQKWKMHVAFHHRDGIVLSTITYNDDGELRPLIYRMSLSEMIVPYGAPEHPHARKFAFDVGEYGVGKMANELSLGCDCLGKIHYLPGAFIGPEGQATTVENAICIHEEDAGLLWKHTDYRQGGRSRSVRNRRLVISMLCTPANYEYFFYYYFYLDGTIEFEIKLSGVLNVYALAPGEPAGPFTTQVAPRIGAQYHQHIFSVRIDPMIDGLQNSVVESDIVSLPNARTGSAENWAGNAFISQERVLRDAADGARDYDFVKDRRWTIVNAARRHYASGKLPGYVLGYRGAAATVFAKDDSWIVRRAGFAKRSLWVVKDVDDGLGGRMWPAGRHVTQTTQAPKDSVEEWVKDDASIENEDIILFLTLGTNHIPRPEDWPVMPVENVRLTLKPVNFFKANPTLDVPSAIDACSTAAFDNRTRDSDNAVGTSCCR